jgi:PilZ domain
MERRAHHRAKLQLPVRLRWSTPFGQKIEISETRNVSRAGLLVSCREMHSVGVNVWVTLPYDARQAELQMEVASRVVRCAAVEEVMRIATAWNERDCESAGKEERLRKAEDALVGVVEIVETAAMHAVALRFEERTRAKNNGNGRAGEQERRKSSRRMLSAPVVVRQENVLWDDEAMTLDLSQEGMRFRTNRQYQPGESVRVLLGKAVMFSWNGKGEVRAKVLRVTPVVGSAALDVCVLRVP